MPACAPSSSLPSPSAAAAGRLRAVRLLVALCALLSLFLCGPSAVAGEWTSFMGDVAPNCLTPQSSATHPTTGVMLVACSAGGSSGAMQDALVVVTPFSASAPAVAIPGTGASAACYSPQVIMWLDVTQQWALVCAVPSPSPYVVLLLHATTYAVQRTIQLPAECTVSTTFGDRSARLWEHYTGVLLVSCNQVTATNKYPLYAFGLKLANPVPVPIITRYTSCRSLTGVVLDDPEFIWVQCPDLDQYNSQGGIERIPFTTVGNIPTVGADGDWQICSGNNCRYEKGGLVRDAQTGALYSGLMMIYSPPLSGPDAVYGGYNWIVYNQPGSPFTACYPIQTYLQLPERVLFVSCSGRIALQKALDSPGTAPDHVWEIDPSNGQDYPDIREFVQMAGFNVPKYSYVSPFILANNYDLEHNYKRPRYVLSSGVGPVSFAGLPVGQEGFWQGGGGFPVTVKANTGVPGVSSVVVTPSPLIPTCYQASTQTPCWSVTPASLTLAAGATGTFTVTPVAGVANSFPTPFGGWGYSFKLALTRVNSVAQYYGSNANNLGLAGVVISGPVFQRKQNTVTGWPASGKLFKGQTVQLTWSYNVYTSSVQRTGGRTLLVRFSNSASPDVPIELPQGSNTKTISFIMPSSAATSTLVTYLWKEGNAEFVVPTAPAAAFTVAAQSIFSVSSWPATMNVGTQQTLTLTPSSAPLSGQGVDMQIVHRAPGSTQPVQGASFFEGSVAPQSFVLQAPEEPCTLQVDFVYPVVNSQFAPLVRANITITDPGRLRLAGVQSSLFVGETSASWSITPTVPLPEDYSVLVSFAAAGGPSPAPQPITLNFAAGSTAAQVFTFVAPANATQLVVSFSRSPAPASGSAPFQPPSAVTVALKPRLSLGISPRPAMIKPGSSMTFSVSVPAFNGDYFYLQTRVSGCVTTPYYLSSVYIYASSAPRTESVTFTAPSLPSSAATAVCTLTFTGPPASWAPVVPLDVLVSKMVFTLTGVPATLRVGISVAVTITPSHTPTEPVTLTVGFAGENANVTLNQTVFTFNSATPQALLLTPPATMSSPTSVSLQFNSSKPSELAAPATQSFTVADAAVFLVSSVPSLLFSDQEWRPSIRPSESPSTSLDLKLTGYFADATSYNFMSSMTFPAGSTAEKTPLAYSPTVAAGQTSSVRIEFTRSPAGAPTDPFRPPAGFTIPVVPRATPQVSGAPTQLVSGVASAPITVRVPASAAAFVLSIQSTSGSTSPASLSFAASAAPQEQTFTVTAGSGVSALNVSFTSDLPFGVTLPSLLSVPVLPADVFLFTSLPSALFARRVAGPITVRPTTAPTSDVTLTIRVNNSAVTLSKSSFTFTAGNWATPQQFTVTAPTNVTADDVVRVQYSQSTAQYAALPDALWPLTNPRFIVGRLPAEMTGGQYQGFDIYPSHPIGDKPITLTLTIDSSRATLLGSPQSQATITYAAYSLPTPKRGNQITVNQGVRVDQTGPLTIGISSTDATTGSVPFDLPTAAELTLQIKPRTFYPPVVSGLAYPGGLLYSQQDLTIYMQATAQVQMSATLTMTATPSNFALLSGASQVWVPGFYGQQQFKVRSGAPGSASLSFDLLLNPYGYMSTWLAPPPLIYEVLAVPIAVRTNSPSVTHGNVGYVYASAQQSLVVNTTVTPVVLSGNADIITWVGATELTIPAKFGCCVSNQEFRFRVQKGVPSQQLVFSMRFGGEGADSWALGEPVTVNVIGVPVSSSSSSSTGSARPSSSSSTGPNRQSSSSSTGSGNPGSSTSSGNPGSSSTGSSSASSSTGSAPPAPPADVTVQVRFTLQREVSALNATWQSAFVAFVAEYMGIDAARVRVVSVVPGSSIVTFAVAAAADDTESSAAEAAEVFTRAFNDPGSDLYNPPAGGSGIAQTVLAGADPAQPATATPLQRCADGREALSCEGDHSSSSSGVGLPLIIVIAVVACVVALLLAAGGCVLYRRRRSAQVAIKALGQQNYAANSGGTGGGWDTDSGFVANPAAAAGAGSAVEMRTVQPSNTFDRLV